MPYRHFKRCSPSPVSQSPYSKRRRTNPSVNNKLTKLQHLPTDIMLDITSRLPIHDLHALRLSGIGSKCPYQNHLLRLEMHYRIRQLYPLFRTARRKGYFPFKTSFCSPLHFASVDHLALYDLELETFRAVERDMPHLQSLTILTNDGFQRNCDRLTSLPRELRNLTQLTHLNLSGHRFERLPSVVCRLHNLTSLDLSGNPDLHVLPEKLGENLKRLTRISLHGTRVRHLPGSLLQALERNHRWCHNRCDDGIRGYRGSVMDLWAVPRLSYCRGMREDMADGFGDDGLRMGSSRLPAISLWRKPIFNY